MEDGYLKNSAVAPLLEPISPTTAAARRRGGGGGGTASKTQTIGNVIVSIVGTGILGLPFAFRIAGWLAGSLGVLIAGVATYYCMLLLVQCKHKLVSEELTPETQTFGDLGHKCLGNTGRFFTEGLIFVSQCGGCVAYLVFIGQNLSSIFKGHGLTISTFIFLLVPVEIALSWINSLSALAPFSIFADVCNVLAMATVVKENVEKVLSGDFGFHDREAVAPSITRLPFALGMAVFCFEGFGMTLSLESSMKERKSFPHVLAMAFTGISSVYVLFGFLGYMAYGCQTKDIITLNLPHNWSTVAVQIGLCLALVFTFPIMVHPVHEIVEGKLKSSNWFQKLNYSYVDGNPTIVGKTLVYTGRAILIVALAILASFVPGFGVFASLVGSTVCALISFVLPATFHLRLLGPSLPRWQRVLDYVILICGLLFAAYGTYSTIFGV